MAALDRLTFGLHKKVPVILQSETAECGLACLAMISSYFGHQVNLLSLRSKFSISLKGSSLANLMQIGTKLQMTSRAVQLDLDNLSQLKLPCILHWDMAHFVVLAKNNKNTLVINDPARGELTLTLAEFSKHFTGVALELTPTAEFSLADVRKKVSIRQMIGAVTGIGRSFAVVLVLAIALEIFALTSPFFMQWIVDHALVSADRSLVTVLGIGFLMLVVVQQIITAMRAWTVTVLSISLNVQWLSNVYAHLLRLPIDFFERRFMGDIVSRFNSVTVIQKTLTTSFVEAIVDGLMAVATAVMMLLYSTTLAFIVFLSVFLYALVRWATLGPYRRAAEEMLVHEAKHQSYFLETLRGIRTVKLFNKQSERHGRWLNALVDTNNKTVSMERIAVGFRTANGLLFGVLSIVVVWLGALQVLDGAFSVGMLFAFVAYQTQFVRRAALLVDKIAEFKVVALHVDRLSDVVLQIPEQEAAPDLIASLSKDNNVIELRDICYRYSESEPYVLNKISLTLEPGESVAIVGASGCGKTTLVKVILGLLKPESGQVLLGGIPIEKLGQERLREIAGTVMQDDQLFAGTIQENISFFDNTVDIERVQASAKLACIDEDIQRMIMGYNTFIGDMGAALSGGQKQRIFLARALYKNPAILVLDEATSHLDVQNEAAVNAAVSKLSLTRIIVAHRPETIATADRIVVMQNGQIVANQKRPKPPSD